MDKIPSFKGEVLICEDNAMNQMFIKELVLRTGIDVVLASNGEEGVNIVSNRMSSGTKPFDLILMDIYMPVMGGLDAADALFKLGNQTPMVAMTSNVTPEDLELYRGHGMKDFLTKPFMTDQVWSCLSKYFTPVGFEIPKQNEELEARQRKKLLTNFVKSNQTTFKDLTAAIESGDIKLAHRIVHTLGSLAGLVGKKTLMGVSRAIEQSLARECVEDVEEPMLVLEHELNKALKEFASLVSEPEPPSPATKTLNKAKASELFKKLEPMLHDDSPKCLALVGELRSIPETDTLVEQLEEYEFELALETLATLKQSLGVN